MAQLISLTPKSRDSKPPISYTVRHHLLDDAEPVTEEELDLLVAKVRKDPKHSGELVLALRACLRFVVGKYLYQWPATRRFENEMVSEGFLALTLLSQEIPDPCKILKTAEGKIRDAIKLFLNENQSAAAPSLRQQYYRQAKGEEPLYLGSNVRVPEGQHPLDGGDEVLRDILDVFCKLDPEDAIDEALMDEFNWGRKYQELADELGVGVGTIYRRKKKLYKRYLELSNEHNSLPVPTARHKTDS